MTKRSNHKVVLASAIAGLLAATATALPAQAEEKAGDKVKCYGVNKCKGSGACAGPNGCGGQNECAGHGHIVLEKDTCLKIQGGRLTPENKKS